MHSNFSKGVEFGFLGFKKLVSTLVLRVYSGVKLGVYSN